jgi:hypothetical protein
LITVLTGSRTVPAGYPSKRARVLRRVVGVSLLVAEPGTPPRSHRFRRQRALSGAVTLCVLGTVIVTLDQVAGGWWAWPAALIGTLA